MKRTPWWFAILVVAASAVMGFILQSDYLSENLRKFLIILSLFGIIGICSNPVEEQ